MRFKAGQEVVCVHQHGWFNTDSKEHHSRGPKYLDIVTINGYDSPYDNYKMVFIKEYPPQSFAEVAFEPVHDITEIKEILEQIPDAF